MKRAPKSVFRTVVVSLLCCSLCLQPYQLTAQVGGTDPLTGFDTDMGFATTVPRGRNVGGVFEPFQHFSSDWLPLDSLAQSYFRLNHVAGAGVGHDDSFTTFGGVVPFGWNNDRLILDAQYRLYNDQTTGHNVGAGWRHYFEDYNRIYGAWAWYDKDESNAINYEQVGLSFESLGKYLDGRLNLYYPLNDSLFDPGRPAVGIPTFRGNDLVNEFSRRGENAMKGFDLEFGGPMPLLGRLGVRGYAGMYHYQGGGEQTWGTSLRAEGYIPKANLTYYVKHTADELFDSNVVFGATWVYGRSRREQQVWRNPNAVVRAQSPEDDEERQTRLPLFHRLIEPAQRNVNVVVDRPFIEDFDVLFNFNFADPPDPNMFRQFFIVHVNSLRGNDVTGDGSFGNPFRTLAGADGVNVQDAIIYVHAGSTFNGAEGSIRLADEQRLLGEGGGLVHNVITEIGGAFVAIPLPAGNPNSTTLPLINNPSGDAIILADYTRPLANLGVTLATVAGFTATGQTGAGGALVRADGASFDGATVNFAGALAAATPSNILITDMTATQTAQGVRINDDDGFAPAIEFRRLTITNPNGNAFEIAGPSNANPSTADVTVSSGAITYGLLSPFNMSAVLVQNHTGDLVFNSATGANTIDASFGLGLTFRNADGTYTFNNTSTTLDNTNTNGASHIDIGRNLQGNASDGDFFFSTAAGSTTLINDPNSQTGRGAFHVDGGTADVMFGATGVAGALASFIDQSAFAQPLVFIEGGHTGTVTFGQTSRLSASTQGTPTAPTGLLFANNANNAFNSTEGARGSYNFNGISGAPGTGAIALLLQNGANISVLGNNTPAGLNTGIRIEAFGGGNADARINNPANSMVDAIYVDGRNRDAGGTPTGAPVGAPLVLYNGLIESLANHSIHVRNTTGGLVDFDSTLQVLTSGTPPTGVANGFAIVDFAEGILIGPPVGDGGSNVTMGGVRVASPTLIDGSVPGAPNTATDGIVLRGALGLGVYTFGDAADPIQRMIVDNPTNNHAFLYEGAGGTMPVVNFERGVIQQSNFNLDVVRITGAPVGADINFGLAPGAPVMITADGPGGTGITIQSSGGTIDFNGTVDLGVGSPMFDDAVVLGGPGIQANTAAINFTDLDIVTAADVQNGPNQRIRGILAVNGGTLGVTTGTINTTGDRAIDMTNTAIALTGMHFTNIAVVDSPATFDRSALRFDTVTGGLFDADLININLTPNSDGPNVNGIEIFNSSADFNFDDGIVTGANGSELSIQGSAAVATGDIRFAASIASTEGAAIDIQGWRAGTITFTRPNAMSANSITATGGGGINAQGILIHGNIGTTINFHEGMIPAEVVLTNVTPGVVNGTMMTGSLQVTGNTGVLVTMLNTGAGGAGAETLTINNIATNTPGIVAGGIGAFANAGTTLNIGGLIGAPTVQGDPALINTAAGTAVDIHNTVMNIFANITTNNAGIAIDLTSTQSTLGTLTMTGGTISNSATASLNIEDSRYNFFANAGASFQQTTAGGAAIRVSGDHTTTAATNGTVRFLPGSILNVTSGSGLLFGDVPTIGGANGIYTFDGNADITTATGGVSITNSAGTFNFNRNNGDPDSAAGDVFLLNARDGLVINGGTPTVIYQGILNHTAGTTAAFSATGTGGLTSVTFTADSRADITAGLGLQFNNAAGTFQFLSNRAADAGQMDNNAAADFAFLIRGGAGGGGGVGVTQAINITNSTGTFIFGNDDMAVNLRGLADGVGNADFYINRTNPAGAINPAVLISGGAPRVQYSGVIINSQGSAITVTNLGAMGIVDFDGAQATAPIIRGLSDTGTGDVNGNSIVLNNIAGTVQFDFDNDNDFLISLTGGANIATTGNNTGTIVINNVTMAAGSDLVVNAGTGTTSFTDVTLGANGDLFIIDQNGTGTLNFTNVMVTDGAVGIGSAAAGDSNINFVNTDITGRAGLPAFFYGGITGGLPDDMTTGTGTQDITFDATSSITQANNERVVSIRGLAAAGTMTFNSPITATAPGATSSTGILITSLAGLVDFNGAVNLGAMGGAAGLDNTGTVGALSLGLVANAVDGGVFGANTGTIDFNLLNIFTDTNVGAGGAGLVANQGGNLRVGLTGAGAASTISTDGGSAINMTDTFINTGADSFRFANVTALNTGNVAGLNFVNIDRTLGGTGNIRVITATTVTGSDAEGVRIVNNNSAQDVNFTFNNVTVNDVDAEGFEITNTAGNVAVTGTYTAGNIAALDEVALFLNNNGVLGDTSTITFGTVNLTTAGDIGILAAGPFTVFGISNGSVTTTGSSALDLQNITLAGTGLNFNAGVSATAVGANEGVHIDNVSGGGATGITMSMLTIDGVTGALNSININNTASNVTINGGSITDTTGTGHVFNVDGGGGNITYAGTITESMTSTGNIVRIVNRTGGTATFGGAITATGATNNGILINSALANSVTFNGAYDFGVVGTPIANDALNIAGANTTVTFNGGFNAFTSGVNNSAISATANVGSTNNLTIANPVMNVVSSTGHTVVELTRINSSINLTTVNAGDGVGMGNLGNGNEGLSFLDVNNFGGPFAFQVTGTTTVDDPGNAAGVGGIGIDIQGGSGTFNFLGDVTVTGRTAQGIRVLNTLGLANQTINFNGITTVGASANANVNAAVEINGAANPLNNSSINFADLRITQSGGNGLLVQGNAANVTVSDITTAGIIALNAVNIMNNTAASTTTLSSATIGGTIGQNGLNIQGNAGNVIFTDGTISGATGHGINITANNATTTNIDIQQATITGNTGAAVNVLNNALGAGGQITLGTTGAITATATNLGGGVIISGNTGTGSTGVTLQQADVDTVAAGTGISIVNSTRVTVGGGGVTVDGGATGINVSATTGTDNRLFLNAVNIGAMTPPTGTGLAISTATANTQLNVNLINSTISGATQDFTATSAAGTTLRLNIGVAANMNATAQGNNVADATATWLFTNNGVAAAMHVGLLQPPMGFANGQILDLNTAGGRDSLEQVLDQLNNNGGNNDANNTTAGSTGSVTLVNPNTVLLP